MLADRKPRKAQHGLPCSVGLLLGALPEGEALTLQSWLDNRKEWTAAAIWEALKDEGHTVGKQTVPKHRNRGCRCFQ